MPLPYREPTAARHDAFVVAVEAYNRAHPAEPLLRPAARLLYVMFGAADVCHLSLDALAAEGFKRDNLPRALRALGEAGLLSKQAGTAHSPNTYRLQLPMGVVS